MNSKNEIAIIGCRFNTVGFIRQFLRDGFEIDYVLTLSANVPNPPENVSGFANVAPICEKNSIPYYRAEDYSLDSKNDLQELKYRDFDLGICVGWQRILPEWFLDNFSHGIYGMHGRYKRLPEGRGHSPSNWTLIHGADEFNAHVMRLKPGTDDGDLLEVRTFKLTQFDDISSVQTKARIIFNRIMKNNLTDILSGKAELTPQSSNKEPSYFSKRNPEDGLINWKKTAGEIYDFVRAQTHPYPGAFSQFNGHTITIWEGRPFATDLNYDQPAGTIVEVGQSGLVVTTKKGTFMVRDYENHTGWKPEIKQRFYTFTP